FTLALDVVACEFVESDEVVGVAAHAVFEKPDCRFRGFAICRQWRSRWRRNRLLCRRRRQPPATCKASGERGNLQAKQNSFLQITFHGLSVLGDCRPLADLSR